MLAVYADEILQVGPEDQGLLRAAIAMGTLTMALLLMKIDEVDLFNRALDASEIQAIFDANTAGKCKP